MRTYLRAPTAKRLAGYRLESRPTQRDKGGMNGWTKNIFVVGLEPFNLRILRAVRHSDEYAFHELLSYEEIALAKRFDMEALLDKARGILREFPGTFDCPGRMTPFSSTPKITVHLKP